MTTAHLVIVDDEVAHMRALCDTLGFEGYRVTGFNSPSQALRALSEHECDLLLTDLKMPEMDGIELIRAARAVDPDIAGVIMTGHGTIDTAVSAAAACRDVLTLSSIFVTEFAPSAPALSTSAVINKSPVS